DDADGALLDQAGNQFADFRFRDDTLDRVPLDTVQLAGLKQGRDRRRRQAGNHRNHRLQLLLGDVHLDAYLILRRKRALQEDADLVDLLALPRELQGGAVGDELRIRFKELADDAQTIGAQRASRLCYLDDGVHQAASRLGFGRAPRKLDVDRNPL